MGCSSSLISLPEIKELKKFKGNVHILNAQEFIKWYMQKDSENSAFDCFVYSTNFIYISFGRYCNTQFQRSFSTHYFSGRLLKCLVKIIQLDMYCEFGFTEPQIQSFKEFESLIPFPSTLRIIPQWNGGEEPKCNNTNEKKEENSVYVMSALEFKIWYSGLSNEEMERLAPIKFYSWNFLSFDSIFSKIVPHYRSMWYYNIPSLWEVSGLTNTCEISFDKCRIDMFKKMNSKTKFPTILKVLSPWEDISLDVYK